MTTLTSIDHTKVLQAAKALKANPPLASEVAKDPIKFLESQGITLGADVEALIKSKGAFTIASAPRQASIIHIDV